MEPIRCERAVCADLQQALSLEWLETNGLGGFASSTISGANTRRYHGLLIAATKPPVGRMLLLSKLEETVVAFGRRYELSTNQYPGVIHPQGYQYLRQFRLDPFPTFVYQIENLELEKQIFMVHGENTVVVEYKVRNGECELELRPLIAFRDYHATTHKNNVLNPHLIRNGNTVAVTPYPGLPSLYLSHNGTSVEDGVGWYLNFEFDRERERGLDYQEDLFNPMLLRFKIEADSPATVLASTETHEKLDIIALRDAEVRRRASIRASAPLSEALVERLTTAADQFIVQRGRYKSVIAGYHWFGDWGRDTMIALPGLALVTRRFEIAREILQVFAENLSDGMLPNRFPDAGEVPEYNTVDAALWFFEAVRKYISYTGDFDFVRTTLYEPLKESLAWHLRGTRYGIRVDKDGLLSCGAAGVQLTWMDAKIGDYVATPRSGKPVEIQALWYNALCIMEDLARRFGEDTFSASIRQLAMQASTSFNNSFWNEMAGCLYDVIDGDNRDASIRPNQIFAVSLHHTMLHIERAKQVVEIVDRELRTPIGLRTLDRQNPEYRRVYEGDPRSRDLAYHQGTVWPWLIGPFISAYLRVHPGDDAARQEAKSWLDAFYAHMETACLGQISEVADGDVPHFPRGCVAQAWSVAEVLRSAVEDIYGVGPVNC